MASHSPMFSGNTNLNSHIMHRDTFNDRKFQLTLFLLYYNQLLKSIPTVDMKAFPNAVTSFYVPLFLCCSKVWMTQKDNQQACPSQEQKLL